MGGDQDDFGLTDEQVAFSDEGLTTIDPARDPHVMTVLGPVDPGALGVTLRHEHLLAAPPATVPAEPDFLIDDRDAALADAEAFGFAGGQTIVDCTTPDNGRDLDGLAWVSAVAGLHIVATAGFHTALHSRDVIGAHPAETLAAALIAECFDDADGVIRPGQLKAGTSRDRIEPTERVALEAIALAHRATGLPILTHTEAGTMALEQVDVLVAAGVDPAAITLSHLDRRGGEPEYLRRVLATGVTIGFDQLGKPRHGPDEPKAVAIAGLIADGFGTRIVISHDMARRSLRPGYGGAPGLTWILDRFTLMLLEAGVSAADVRMLLIDNPARGLTARPPG